MPERRGPSRTRTLAWSMVFGLGVAVVFGMSGPFLVKGKAPPAPASAWEELAPAGGGFRILVPGKPAYTPLNQGFATLHKYTVTRDQGDAVFHVGYFDLPAGVPLDRDEILRGGAQAEAAAQGGRLKDKNISLDGHPGIEVEIDTPGKGTTVGRMYLVGRRLYILEAAGGKVTASAPEVRKFLTSFQLDGKAADEVAKAEANLAPAQLWDLNQLPPGFDPKNLKLPDTNQGLEQLRQAILQLPINMPIPPLRPCWARPRPHMRIDEPLAPKENPPGKAKEK